jgi:O-antigen/teichoic acid export membrane protein
MAHWALSQGNASGVAATGSGSGEKMLKRIMRMFAALGTGVGITFVNQLALPPAFLHYYGVSSFGEWLVLTATLNYLSNLNFGIGIYASNELTILHRRNCNYEYRLLQASTLALVLATIVLGMLISASAFLMPLDALLHLRAISLSDARWTAFLLGLQAMVNILGGYYGNLFMVVGKSHRGVDWNNARRLAATLISLPLIVLRASFSLIALGQFAAVLLITLLSILDLKRMMGPLPLGLRGANWKTAKASLAPSGLFAMVYMQLFLIYQAPVILLQWILGPQVVVLFTIGRTILAIARQFLQTITDAIRPEITFAFAARENAKLLQLFHTSEKVVFSLIPIANLGTFLFSPLLLAVWLHKPALFDLYTYALITAISAVSSMKEHKQFFLFSTNTHERYALISFFGNLLMIAVSIPSTLHFGIYGFLYVWLASEATQMGLLYRENKKLLGNDPSINLLPILKLISVLLISLPLCAAILHQTAHHSLWIVSAAAAAGSLLLVVESYFVFGVREVWDLLRSRLKQTSASAPVAA